MAKIKSFTMASIAFILVLFSGLIWADSNGIWHHAQDIRPGTFGEDETLNGYNDPTVYYIFDNPVEFNRQVEFNDNVSVSGEMAVDVIKPNSGNNVIIQLG